MDNKTALEALRNVIVEGRFMGYNEVDPKQIANFFDEAEYLVTLILQDDGSEFLAHLDHIAKKFPQCAYIAHKYRQATTITPVQRNEYEAKAQEMRLPFVDLTKYKPYQDAITTLPEHIAKRLNVIPLKRENNILYVATAQPQNMTIIDELRLLSRCTVRAVMASPSDIAEALEKYYPE